MSGRVEEQWRTRVRPAVSQAAFEVRQQISRVDNAEVRKARHLARRARRDQLDVLVFGDSAMSWIAPYDVDRRPLHQMFRDAFPADLRTHVVHGGSYNPLLFDQFVRFVEATRSRPVVVMPMAVRLGTLPWLEHPVHGHRRASGLLAAMDSSALTWRIRSGLAKPSSESFERFYALEHPTWVGDLTIGDYVKPLKAGGLDQEQAARLLYAYHHGGEVLADASLDRVVSLGARLRRMGVPVVVYQTPIPIEQGEAYYGPGFRTLAERNFAVLEEAFVSECDSAAFVRTGLTTPTEHFIDRFDGTEHLNEHGRAALLEGVLTALAGLGVERQRR